MRPAVLLLSIVALVACVRRGPEPVVGGGSGGEGEQVPPPTGDPLADALAARDADLGARGYRVLGSPVRGQLAPSALTDYPVAAQSGLCYVAFALAADPATDLDLFVYDSDGVEVARHVAPAANSAAFVGFCPPRAGRHFVHVHAYAGSGDYVFAAYEGSAPPEGLDAAFAVSATPSAGGPAVDPVAASRVASRDDALAREGYTRAGAPSLATFGRREARTVTANLENGRCYAFLVLTGAHGQDLDLTLFAPGGQRLERDDSSSANASVKHCPIVAGRYGLEVKLADGEGPVWLATYVRGSAPATAIASFEAAGATAGPVAVPAPTDGPRHVIDHDLRARGYQPFGEPVTGTLAEGGAASQEVSLEGGHCYALSAAADLPLSAIDLAVFDRNTEMARDAAGRAWAVTRVCPVRAVRVRAEARAAGGAGAYELRTWVWPRSTQGPFGLQGAIFVRLSEATSLLGHDGLEPATAPTVVDAREGTPVRADVELAPGTCYAIVAAGGPEVREVELSLLAASTVLATATPREPVAIVRRCIEARARHRLELRVTRGSGQVLHQVFQTPEAAAAPAPDAVGAAPPAPAAP